MKRGVMYIRKDSISRILRYSGPVDFSTAAVAVQKARIDCDKSPPGSFS